MFRKTLALATAGSFGLISQVIAGAPALISLTQITPDPVRPGDTIEILAEVTSNPTGLAPVASNLRLTWNSDVVQYVDFFNDDLGETLTGPVEGVAPNLSIDFLNTGEFDNTDLTPGLARFEFLVVGGVADAATFTIGPDPQSSGPLLALNGVRIENSYDAPLTITIADFEFTGTGDLDRDGLSNDAENVLRTNADRKDSDGDGFEDGVEIAIETDPLDPADPADATDADGDGIPDFADNDPASSDSDNDGYKDAWEIASGSDPDNDQSTPSLGDSNGDGNAEFTDGVIAFNLFLGVLTPEGFGPEENRDIDRNANFDAIDAVLLFNWFLGNVEEIPFQ